jgi:hypothetical protein
MLQLFHIVSAVIALGGPMFVILYDIVALELGGREATISHVVRGWAETFHELPYIVAAVLVWLWLHLFFEVLIRHVLALKE